MGVAQFSLIKKKEVKKLEEIYFRSLRQLHLIRHFSLRKRHLNSFILIQFMIVQIKRQTKIVAISDRFSVCLHIDLIYASGCGHGAFKSWGKDMNCPLSPFLDASTHLYMRVCPSVGQSVGPSVRPSVPRFFRIAEFI